MLARGLNTNNSVAFTSIKDGHACTNLTIYEEDQREMNNAFQIQDCSNHNCTSDLAGTFVASPQIAPSGHVVESIPNTQQGFIDFGNQILSYVGTRPAETRLPWVATHLAQAINHVDGVGERGGWNVDGGYGPDAPYDLVIEQGGISVITPSAVGSRNPLTQCPSHPGNPSNSPDTIGSSGLTQLHEWVVECFMDDVMPTGYRESL